MSNDGLKTLCLKIAYAESEAGVIEILRDSNLWDDAENWEYYGQNENNFSIIGNQQSSPDTALVEKIVNSVDAVLLRECRRAGIDPQSAEAPTDIKSAQEKFFKIRDGKLSNISANERTRLAENIVVVATGGKKQPCYSIIDKGEGQTPDEFENTFLSLSKSNKLRIPFVQGKFNMGSAGALQFCGRHNIQLIISKRDPQLNDPNDKWGFTVIRREDPSGNMRSSTFRYLKVGGKLPSFESKSLMLLPGEYPNAYGSAMEFGTYVKLYDYDIRGGMNTMIKFEFYYRFSLLLPHIALPVMLYERRRNYKSQGYYIPITGLSVRLDDDKANNLEGGFPSSSEINLEGELFKIQVYAFKPGRRDNYTNKDGVIFTYNGQAHGFLSKAFFERKAVGMSYLSDSILVMVDCSEISVRAREDLFMNSRDRLRDKPLLASLERSLEKILKEHPGLRLLREERRREEIESKLKDSKPLTDALRDIINNSPSLARLLMGGFKLTNPFAVEESSINENFDGSRFATYFTPTKKYTKERPKDSPINRGARLQFETDVSNDYFIRDDEPGDLNIYLNSKRVDDYSLNLWNGLATITVTIPSELKENDLVELTTELVDPRHTENFVSNSYLKILPPVNKIPSPGGRRKSPPSNDPQGKGRQQPSGLSLPEIIKVDRSEWNKYAFNEKSALEVKEIEGAYTFYVNMDNIYLLNELKSSHKTASEILQARYSYALVLLSMSLISHINENNGDSDVSIFQNVRQLCDGVAPVILPTISALGDLE